MVDIEVKMGNSAVTRRSSDNLTASGIGSCLVITLYDPKRKVGALAHAMLPSNSPARDERQGAMDKRRDAMYVGVAIDEMLKKIKAFGAKREDLEAKLIGGANMFAAFKSDIGKQNVLSAKEKLKKEGIKLVGEAVGGSIGRSVEFCVASGIVTVKKKF